MNPEWDERALDVLADIWVQITPAERERVEAAVNRVNRLLRDDPLGRGESRTSRVRVMFEEPLTVFFRAVAGQVARVLHVRFVRRR